LSSSAFEEKNQEMTMSLPAHHRFLHLRKKLKNDDKPPGSPSSATLEKKNKEMTMNQGGLPSFTTLQKKNKEMMTS
jgi:hypothetical protein